MDPRLRELERRWRERGAFEDGHAYAQALVRARGAPLDLAAEVLAATPDDARSLLEGVPEVGPLDLGVDLPAGLSLRLVSVDLWQYTRIGFVFAELEGVAYLLPPWRGRGTLDRIPGVLWPTAAEVGAEVVSAWRAAVGYA
ncbi:MAG: hypothetical protein R3F62_07215 [Planctomycetota bacterium]